jgi:hypothetical protein
VPLGVDRAAWCRFKSGESYESPTSLASCAPVHGLLRCCRYHGGRCQRGHYKHHRCVRSRRRDDCRPQYRSDAPQRPQSALLAGAREIAIHGLVRLVFQDAIPDRRVPHAGSVGRPQWTSGLRIDSLERDFGIGQGPQISPKRTLPERRRTWHRRRPGLRALPGAIRRQTQKHRRRHPGKRNSGCVWYAANLLKSRGERRCAAPIRGTSVSAERCNRGRCRPAPAPGPILTLATDY